MSAGTDDAETRGLPQKEIADVPCPFCGCLCDDLQVTVRAGRVAAAAGACVLAQPHFLAGGTGDEPACQVKGRTATVEEGLQRAARILADARYPLVYGLSRATCEAQRLAVAIAERIGGVIDTPSGRKRLPSTMATVGEVTCTLGEIRNRADLIVVWGADPMTTHPRFFERFAPDALGSEPTRLSPGQRPGTIVVDSHRTATAAAAQHWILIRQGKEFEAATVLRAAVRGLPLDETEVAAETGVPLADWQRLAARMTRASYGVLLTGQFMPDEENTLIDGRERRSASHVSEALQQSVRDLNDRTRFVSLALETGGNLAGADNVLTWQTGFPFGVDFSKGYPRFNPGEFNAETLLERGETDAMLVVCEDPLTQFSEAARRRLREIPVIAMDWQLTTTFREATIALRAAVWGTEAPGTLFRLDGIPLALRPILAPQFANDCELLAALAAALAHEE